MSLHLEEILKSDGPVFVRNNLKKPTDIYLTAPEPGTQKVVSMLIPNTRLPIDLLRQVSKEALRMSSDLRDFLNKRYIVLVESAVAESELANADAQHELAELFTPKNSHLEVYGPEDDTNDGEVDIGAHILARPVAHESKDASQDDGYTPEKVLKDSLRKLDDDRVMDGKNRMPADGNVDPLVVGTITRLQNGDLSERSALNRLRRHRFMDDQARLHSLDWISGALSSDYHEISRWVADQLHAQVKYPVRAEKVRLKKPGTKPTVTTPTDLARSSKLDPSIDHALQDSRARAARRQQTPQR